MVPEPLRAVDTDIGHFDGDDDGVKLRKTAGDSTLSQNGVQPVFFNNEMCRSSHHYGQRSANTLRDDSAEVFDGEPLGRGCDEDTDGSAKEQKNKKDEEDEGEPSDAANVEKKVSNSAHGEARPLDDDDDDDDGGGDDSRGRFTRGAEQHQATQQEQTLRKLQTMRWSLDDFRLLSSLGSGRASTVYRAQHVSTGVDFAIKKYVRELMSSSYDLQLIEREIAMHRSLFHPAITSFYGSFKDKHGNIYLMLEYAKRGDVFNLLYNGDAVDDAMSESEACERVIGPLISAVAHLHARDIVHRDIKPENLLMSNDSLGCKLADYGFAVDTGDHRDLTVRLGTLEYMAPEIMRCDPNTRAALLEEGKSGYGKEVDCWAIGILAYECLVGHTPFEGQSVALDDMVARVCRGEVDFDPRNERCDVSWDARNFILSCLALDPKSRLTAEQMLRHPWITKSVAEANRRKSAEMMKACGSESAACIQLQGLVNIRPKSFAAAAGSRGNTPWAEKETNKVHLERPTDSPSPLGNDEGTAPGHAGDRRSGRVNLVGGGVPSTIASPSAAAISARDGGDVEGAGRGGDQQWSPTFSEDKFNNVVDRGGSNAASTSSMSRSSKDRVLLEHLHAHECQRSRSFTSRMFSSTLRRFQRMMTSKTDPKP